MTEVVPLPEERLRPGRGRQRHRAVDLRIQHGRYDSRGDAELPLTSRVPPRRYRTICRFCVKLQGVARTTSPSGPALRTKSNEQATSVGPRA